MSWHSIAFDSFFLLFFIQNTLGVVACTNTLVIYHHLLSRQVGWVGLGGKEWKGTERKGPGYPPLSCGLRDIYMARLGLCG